MKILIGIFILLLHHSCSTKSNEKAYEFERKSDTIQIVMFHFSQRCTSCSAVENETMAFLKKNYHNELKNNKIRFLSFDLFSENGRLAADELNATGQHLFIVKGDSIADLTPTAFLFAYVQPEKFIAQLQHELKKFTH